MKLISFNYLNRHYNLPGTLIVSFIFFSLLSYDCVSSLPLNTGDGGHSDGGDRDGGQSISDYTGLINGDALTGDPLPTGLSIVSSPLAAHNNYDLNKDWMDLKSLLKGYERQRALSQSNHKNWKRSCSIDAGMTYNCDFRQLLSAVHARKYLESSMTPGRRKRLLPALLPNQPFNYINQV